MRHSEIVELAQGLCGKLDSQQAALLEAFCRQWQSRLALRLKAEYDPDDGICSEAFGTAAALYAAAALRSCLESGSGCSSITVGDVSIGGLKGGSLPEDLSRQAELILQPYVKDESFVFLGVRCG